MIRRQAPGPGQESVWDYPRPPRVEPVSERIRIVFNGKEIANTTRAKRVLETSHPPTYYLPTEDLKMEYITESRNPSTFCEWKGAATYYNVAVDGKKASAAGWAYYSPSRGFESIRGHIAFYASRMDACYVGEEKVTPQAGDFYGGWVTSKVVGPFKGEPGTYGW